MNKADLVAVLAEKMGSTKKDAEKSLTAFIECIEESLVKGEKISLVGFGTFEVKARGARKGINPQTKKPINIAASKVPTFKVSKALKDIIAGK